MKINKKALELIEKGLSSNTVSKLTESQINVLHSKLIPEQVKQEKKQITKTTIPASTARTVGANVDGVSIKMDPAGNVVASQTTEGEMDEQDDLDNNDALGAETMQNVTGQSAPHDEKDMAPDGMDDDSDNDRKEMGESKKKETNPWAICTAQLGKEFGTKERHLWSSKEKNKYERCVKDVKSSLKEGKNPVSLFIESQIMKIVEKNLPPRITKGDLIKHLSESESNFATKHIQTSFGDTAPAKPKTKPGIKTEPKQKPSHPGKNPNPGENPAPKAKKEVGEQSPSIAPSKPKTEPGIKPGKPSTKPRPSHPGKNPNPGENPAPKAKKLTPERAKNEVIDVIIKMLEK